MAEPTTETPRLIRRRELEYLARLERVAAELRALARDADPPTARRPLLGATVHDWERDVAAARRRLHTTARRARTSTQAGVAR